MTTILDLSHLTQWDPNRAISLARPGLPVVEQTYPDLGEHSQLEIAACLCCLHGVPLSKKANEKAYQYRMKHLCEEVVGVYVHSKSFHRAAKIAGVPYEHNGSDILYYISDVGLSFMARRGVTIPERFLLRVEELYAPKKAHASISF